jgi:hypothetical protein
MSRAAARLSGTCGALLLPDSRSALTGGQAGGAGAAADCGAGGAELGLFWPGC